MKSANACYQCRRCSAGCPVVPWADHPPHRIVRWVREGRSDRAADTTMIWTCASCMACTVRCPNGVPVADLMDELKRDVLARGAAVRDPDVLAAHRSFLWGILRFGRVHELSMIALFKMKTRRFFEDVKLGMALFFRGKLKLLPRPVKRPDTIRKKKRS